jgi:hypothetical protein
MDPATGPHFGVCVANEGAEDLQLRMVYRVLPDESAGRHGMIRVIDDSGEDYLYPGDFFVPLKLPEPAEARLAALVLAEGGPANRSLEVDAP